MTTKRYAANYILTPSGEKLRQHVVEIADGCVVRLFPLDGEMENVEWLLGAIQIENEVEGIVAYHLYPYDFSTMSCVGETRRTLLR